MRVSLEIVLADGPRSCSVRSCGAELVVDTVTPAQVQRHAVGRIAHQQPGKAAVEEALDVPLASVASPQAMRCSPQSQRSPDCATGSAGSGGTSSGSARPPVLEPRQQGVELRSFEDAGEIDARFQVG